MLTEQLSHLPDTKRRELERVVQVLFDEFEDATKSKLSDKKKLGRILKVILFGSYARGDWVEDRLSGYRSDYDLLIIVNSHQFTDLHEYWAKADEHFIRELTVTQHIKTPVNFIVHSLEDVNDQVAKGRPFFSDIARDGIMLYEAPGHPLVKTKRLTDDEIRTEAQGYFDQWFPLVQHAVRLAETSMSDRVNRDAAFMLHQAAERAYHCALLVLTLYSPKSHRITMLRSQAEALDDRLKAIWPNETKLHRQAFDRLRRAYVEARYSAEYTVSVEELNWLNERIAVLRDKVETICKERLAPKQTGI
jgi:uncharacterized protein